MTVSLQRQFAIVAPPPTPNGDLHVGHLSGPYLGADILARYLKLKGAKVTSALSVDLNQTYVVTTAERLDCEPMELARKSHGEITDTLNAANIDFDVVGIPNQAYSAYVTSWFEKLYAAGVLKHQKRQAPYDPKRGRFMFESYASGWCNICLSETKGNICESCGHANDPADLFGLYPTGGQPGDKIEFREIIEYVLDLEALRIPLEQYLWQEIPEFRPGLRRLIEEIFSKPLPPFPVTFPSSWGIKAPFPDADGLVLNVWAEMVPGHYYWLNQAHQKNGTFDALVTRTQGFQYIQFLGFDNSFFYVIAHLALSLAARQSGVETLVPTAFITNEFLQLENFKFSTSQGHLIWGRDLLSEAPVDDVRFYLAWINPEYNQANFSRQDFENVSRKKFQEPLETLIANLKKLDMQNVSPTFSPFIRSMVHRFEAAYEPKRPSLRMAALTLANGLALGNALIARREVPGTIQAIAQVLAAGSAPLVPDTASRLWAAAGGRGPISWPDLDAQSVNLRRIA